MKLIIAVTLIGTLTLTLIASATSSRDLVRCENEEGGEVYFERDPDVDLPGENGYYNQTPPVDEWVGWGENGPPDFAIWGGGDSAMGGYLDESGALSGQIALVACEDLGAFEGPENPDDPGGDPVDETEGT